DSTRFIQASIDEVQFSLGQAVAIVVAVIFLFLGSFRSVLIPIVTIPLSLIGAGIIMAALGFTLNLLTLLAMVLAIGLVVDDAIVVSVTLSPMMCSLLLSRTSAQGWFARQIDRGFSWLADAYDRRLRRSLDYRPVTALFALAVFAALAFMYMHTKAELAPEEDQGV